MSISKLESGGENWVLADQDQNMEKTGLIGKSSSHKVVNKDSILNAAKSQGMSTGVKQAVFQAIMISEDYLQAFENLSKLNLKK